MTELLRLLRLALILQFVLGLIPASGTDALWLKALALAPVLMLIAITSVLLARNAEHASGLRPLLIGVIAAFTWQNWIEIVALRLLSGLSPALNQVYLRWVTTNNYNEPSILLVAPVTLSLLFSLLTALLGAWLGGRRSAVFWASVVAVSIVVNTVSLWLAAPDVFTNFGDHVAENIAWIVVQTMLVGLMCYFVGSLADQQRDKHAQLQQANAQLAHANALLAAQAHVREHLGASRERVRLARNLHDTLAHTLAGLAIQLDGVRLTMPASAPQRGDIALAADLANEGLQHARQAILTLRADAVGELGLVEAIRQRLDALARRTGARTTLEVTGDVSVLDGETAEALLGVAQEAVNNIERHAGAQLVAVMLTPRTLVIRDDGAGFGADAVRPGGFGIRGMRERAELIGATVSIESRPGEGAVVTVHFGGIDPDYQQSDKG